jgi:hypothetical protein
MSSSLTTLSMSLRLSSSVIRTFHCGASALRAQSRRGPYVSAGGVADGAEDHCGARQPCKHVLEHEGVVHSRCISIRETAMLQAL